MSSKIKILPENLANKIAAGEVVQRPESVVKELLENSIDAGATSIEVMIKRAGKVLIQVCDDGSGMEEEDCILCIQKHATSKILVYDDLEAIKTLGFRGEALSSIAAVSQFEIRSETIEQDLGTLIRVDEQGIIEKEKGSFNKGTCVTIKNLFYNTPARRNFLKTDATELRHIIDTFNKIALSRPEIAFKFFNEDELILSYNTGSLEDRISAVFADNMLDALIPVEEKTEYLSVHGYIGKPSMLKKSKGEQYIFFNNRFVLSKQINHAVFTAYENVLEKGDYPFFVLFLQIDPARVDVNVHPSKLEIKFEKEKDVYNFVLTVIKKSLSTHDLVPSLEFSSATSEKEKLRFNAYSRTETSDFSDRPDIKRNQSYVQTNFSDQDIDLIFSSIPETLNRGTEQQLDSGPFDSVESRELHHTPPRFESTHVEGTTPVFIVQLHNKYILSQIKSGLMIIDQHAAHERILYEKALKRIETNLPFSQQLIFPITLQVDPATLALIKELNSFLTRLGFELKFFSMNTIIIEGVPDDVKKGSEEIILRELLSEFVINQREKKLEQTDNIAKSYSCKTAIKSGDNLTDREMRTLIDQLFATSMPYVCPHGRPIVVKIALDEFDRRFGRT